jgi:hypothetical protein
VTLKTIYLSISSYFFLSKGKNAIFTQQQQRISQLLSQLNNKQNTQQKQKVCDLEKQLRD